MNLATGAVLQRFLERVGRDLEREPLKLGAEEHRRLLADLLARCGAATHFEILGLATGAEEAEVAAAFQRLARRVHPRHAAPLGLEDQAGVLEILFERATEAYLVLSDPQRRAEYVRTAAVERQRAPADPERRAEEARSVARDLLRRAERLLGREDRFFAVELLRQAVRLDPRSAEAWALLGRTQMENPHWLHTAEDSLRRAAQLRPESADYRFLLGELAERREDREEAERRYREVLERTPGHPAASEARERLRRNR